MVCKRMISAMKKVRQKRRTGCAVCQRNVVILNKVVMEASLRR